MLKKINYKRISVHIVFWISLLILYTFLYGRSNSSYVTTFVHLLATLPIYLGATYFTLYYVIPKYLLTKKYVQAIIPIVYMLLSTAFFQVIITIMFSIQVDIKIFGETAVIDRSSIDIFNRLIGIYIVVFFAASMKLLKHWYDIQNKNRNLVEEKLKAELQLLKAQVNPHFLFNTLNNLYGLALKKSDQTPEIILKLSEMMDYFLYKCNTDLVLLKDEIEMIKNYIDLERLRYTDKLSIDFKTEVANSEMQIAPLMIIPFIENAFKHSAGSSKDKTEISIKIKSKLNSFELEVVNNYKEKENKSKISSGIGLENVKKRLEMIYPDQHILEINKTEDLFAIKLKIENNRKKK